VASPAWERLKGAYQYDAGAPLAVTEELRPDPTYHLARLSFTKATGHRLSGLLIHPRTEGIFPCVLLLHGLSSDKETMIHTFGRDLAAHGLAGLALDAHLHGERKADSPRPLGPLEYLDLARESIVEYRQALDYLQTRGEIDPARIGLLGYSLGAMMGAILAGVDERIKACVFLVGGDMLQDSLPPLPPVLRDLLETVSPTNFVPRISPRPVLFINGRWDTTVPPSAAVLLHEAAGEPKQIIWADAGHMLPADAMAQGVRWLAQQFDEGEGLQPEGPRRT
jgi:uncharacterized protein